MHKHGRDIWKAGFSKRKAADATAIEAMHGAEIYIYRERERDTERERERERKKRERERFKRKRQ